MPDTLTAVPTTVRHEPHALAADPSEPAVHGALPAGTRLDEFEVIRVLGAGGFGIVYLALDHVLLRYVAIKEYMPAALAGRTQGATVAVRAPSNAPTYNAGLESFFSEARMLASFDHPSLVKVYRFWKAHGTAYMAMQYYPGQTLREARRDLQGAPDEAWLRAFIDPLLGALERLHDEGIYHRDIAPDNILLLPDGSPVLLDFGSARQVIGDRTQSLTAILKPNFAPIEQYADEPGMRQGPWTDLYALGATVHFMLTGAVPVPAVLRAVRDTLPALTGATAAAYPGVGPHLLATIDWTLALAPEDRPQGVATMRQALNGEVSVPPRAVPAFIAPPAVAAPVSETAYAPTLHEPSPAAPRPPQPAAVTAPHPAPRAARAAAAPTPARRSRTPLIAGAVALVATIAVIAGMRMSNATDASVAAPVAAASAASAVSITPAVVERSDATSVAPPALPPVAADSGASAPAPVASAPKAAPPPRAMAEPRAAATKPAAAASMAAAAAAAASAADARRARPPMPSAASAPTAAAVVAKSPKELCGDLNFVSMALCVSRQCEAPALQAHPQCVEARRYDEQRRRRMDQQ